MSTTKTSPKFSAQKLGVKLCSYLRNNNISPVYALNYLKCDTIGFINNKQGAPIVQGHLTSKDGYEFVIDIVSTLNRLDTITIEVFEDKNLVETVKFYNETVNEYQTSPCKWHMDN